MLNGHTSKIRRGLKGQLLLIEAVAALVGRGVEVELVLAGDGEMRSAVEESIASHGIGDRVRITGWISSAQVRDELLAARALVLPSFAEGLPVVISTFVAGIPELVRDGIDGWLVPAGDVDALADAMTACLTTSAGRLEEMGRSGHERVGVRHSIDVEAGRLRSMFDAAIAKGAA